MPLNKFTEKDVVDLVEDTNSRIDLMDFADKIQTASNTLNNELGNILSDISEEMLLLFVNSIVSKDYDVLGKLSLPLQEEYAAIINRVLKEMYNYAKVKASEEISVKTPSTQEDAIKKILLNTKNVVDGQFSDLLTAIINLAIVGINKGWDKNKAEISFEALFNNFVKKKVEVGNDQMVMETFNDARNYVFMSYPDIVIGYRLNNSLENILRGVVCPYCKNLHGLTVEFDSPLFYSYHPPFHFKCGCFWEAVTTKDDVEFSSPPDIPSYDTISNFKGLSEKEYGLNETITKDDKEIINLIEELIYE